MGSQLGYVVTIKPQQVEVFVPSKDGCSNTVYLPNNVVNFVQYKLDQIVYVQWAYDDKGEASIEYVEPLRDLMPSRFLHELSVVHTDNFAINYYALCTILSSITDENLIGFVDTFRCDHEFLSHFLTLGASRNHHHSEEGGLLAHSVEVVTSVVGAMNAFEFSDKSYQVALVAALLHDTGKAFASYLGGEIRYIPTQHEPLVFQMFSKALDVLWTNKKSWWELLSMSWLKTHGYDSNPISLAVQNADRLSASVSRANQLFAHAPSYYYFIHNCNRKVFRNPQ
ncbi:TraI domain-containing protein [Vibrio kyushuensis]|uniref:HD domain-containing protein n=1 Tax=Vibrio kyushuensis TaxID=2910249 RepID=UPI003D0B3167